MLVTSFYGNKLQFISHMLYLLSSSNDHLCELVFFSHTKALTFLECHIRLFIELAIWALLFISVMTTVLVQSLNKMHLKYVFHNNSHRKTPVLKMLFNYVTGLEVCNFVMRLQHRCFLVSIGKILRTPVLKKICEQLLLHF